MAFAFGQPMSKKRGREEEDMNEWWMGPSSATVAATAAKRIRSSVGDLSININNNPFLHRPSLPHVPNSFSLRPQIDSPQMLDSPVDAPTPTAPRLSATSSPAHSPQHNAELAGMDMQPEGPSVRIVHSSPPSPWKVPVLGQPPKRSPPPLARSDNIHNEPFATSRVATPIYSSFPQHAHQHPFSNPPPRTINTGLTTHQNPQHPRLLNLNTAISSLQRRDHIMPSPVREADDEMEAEYAFAGSQLSRLSFSSGAGGASDSFLDADSDLSNMDIDPTDHITLSRHNSSSIYDDHSNISPLSRSPNFGTGIIKSRKDLPLPTLMMQDPGLMSPPLLSPRTGRARSGAMSQLVSPTLMTDSYEEHHNRPKKFSFGYREDCDKCRARVAGHFAHFI